MALGLPEDMISHCYVLALKVQGLFLRVAVNMISRRFVKLGILMCYQYSRKYEVKMTLIA